jgi:hypothetical protein
MKRLIWSTLLVTPLALAVAEGSAAAQLSQATTFSAPWTAVFTSPWYPSAPGSEARETAWSIGNRTTSITRAVGFKTAPNPSGGASLPLYVCAHAAEQTRRTVRPYSSLEFVYNKNIACYQSYLARDHGEFLANDSACLGTGATSRLLGYVVSPLEAVAYLKKFGGSLDPIVSCAKHGTTEKSSYGAKDYVLDAEVCTMPVFAGLSTGFSTQQTAVGIEALRHQVPAQNVHTFEIGKDGGVKLYSSNYENMWGWYWNGGPLVGFWGPGINQSYSITSSYSSGGPFPTGPCKIDATFDPSSASAQVGVSLTPAGACALSNLTVKLAGLAGPAITPPPAPAPAPAPTAPQPRMRIPVMRPQPGMNAP